MLCMLLLNAMVHFSRILILLRSILKCNFRHISQVLFRKGSRQFLPFIGQNGNFS